MKELLSVFDTMRAGHETMKVEAFNDELTYKSNLNLVMGWGVRGRLWVGMGRGEWVLWGRC